jgi:hypothetical protein
MALREFTLEKATLLAGDTGGGADVGFVVGRGLIAIGAMTQRGFFDVGHTRATSRGFT